VAASEPLPESPPRRHQAQPLKRLRIGIDAHAIGERKTGNERFMANLVPALRELCQHELVLYFTRPEAAQAWRGRPGTTVRLLRPATPVARIPFTLPYRAARDRLDVLFVQYTTPPIVGCPVVTVVHDVAFGLFPHFFSPLERVWMRRTIPPSMRRAACVVTVSEFSKTEITRVYGIPPHRITVAYDGVDPVFLNPASQPSPLEPPFFLTVGNLQPRKNLATLIRGFRRLVQEHPEVPERLAIVGQEWFDAGAIQREARDLRADGRVVFTGYVSDEQLAGLMQRATAFAYPSVYEGFGLPPVEAMAMGTPTLVADIPVTREVIGDAGLRLSPVDPTAWADGLRRVSTDAALRGRLAAAGPERAARFTWEGCARAVLEALERAAEGGGPRPKG
jgi:glycosyltransferase involved in cell wall biosynthesis